MANIMRVSHTSVAHKIANETAKVFSKKIVDIYTDCDDDTLLITVEQTGAACHTGNHSCFYTKLKNFTQEND